jgi:ATP-dependent DNA helicase RecG
LICRLLKLLEGESLSSGELRKALKLSHRPNFRENYLRHAQQQGFIEYTIPDKPTSRLQKYRLTDKGRLFLERDRS